LRANIHAQGRLELEIPVFEPKMFSLQGPYMRMQYFPDYPQVRILKRNRHQTSWGGAAKWHSLNSALSTGHLQLLCLRVNHLPVDRTVRHVGLYSDRYKLEFARIDEFKWRDDPYSVTCQSWGFQLRAQGMPGAIKPRREYCARRMLRNSHLHYIVMNRPITSLHVTLGVLINFVFVHMPLIWVKSGVLIPINDEATCWCISC
jgi:hypothetical protein